MHSRVVDLLGALGGTLERLGVRWFLFGAQAALVHGAVRLTADVDVTIDLGACSPRALVEALAGSGFRLAVDDAQGFVERTRVLPFVHEPTNMPLDLVLAGPGLEERFFERAAPHILGGVRVPVASAEDLVVMKTLAGRPKDVDDIVSILGSRTPTLDLGYVRETLRLLEQALDQRDLLPAFEVALARADRGAAGHGATPKARRRRPR